MRESKLFISLGIEYASNLFKQPKNRNIYEDTNFPPTKPIMGGFWGSTYLRTGNFKSYWEKYIYEKLNVKMFEHKLNHSSTIFSLKESANILFLDSFQDIWIDMKLQQSNLPLRLVKIAGNVPKQYENHMFLNFEDCVYDAIYVSQNFVECVDYVLKEFERRILSNENADDLAQALYFGRCLRIGMWIQY